MAGASQDKTEAPTPHRIREARKEGQVARSMELSFALQFLGLLLVLSWAGSYLYGGLLGFLKGQASGLSGELTSESVLGFFQHLMLSGLGWTAPFFIACVLLALVINLVQNGFLFTLKPLQPKFSRINPAEGVKRIYSRRMLLEAGKIMVKLVASYLIIGSFIKRNLEVFPLFLAAGPWGVFRLGHQLLYDVLFQVGLFFLVVGVIDYLYQRYEYMKNLRMSVQEMREEYKLLEGDPFVRSRIRELQRKMRRKRMLGEVKKAKVVITNPTHIAVALRYEEATMEVPVLIAKGKGSIAHRIVEIARKEGISVVEMPPLARLIYDTVELDQSIPPDIYTAVAEILVFIEKEVPGRHGHKADAS